MATTSYFSISFTESEKGIIRKILQLPIKQYRYLENEVDALIDIWRMCEIHQLPYQFYDNQKFYCPECLTQKKPTIYHYIRSLNFDPIEESEKESIKSLENELSKYQQQNIPDINFEERQNRMMSQQNNRPNNTNAQVQQIDRENQELMELLKKRTKYLEVQKFISHISIEQRNRKIHDEMHNVDPQMRPSYDFRNQIQNHDNSQFESILKEYFRGQI
ncbi:unnamed protein product [Paramecium octaurelia]|uniref:Uncharacterized protein n=1 Tax=Paramecium octaurelia TaxID=43137 RepID=A0A8S1Y949_PAROT|nr:unnamed protein product [Paramecium octaurelia]